MKRVDSLFARLLLAQTGLALGLAAIFGIVFYAERNAAVDRLLADRWAPVLMQAVGAAPPPPAQPIEVERSDSLPAGARLAAALTPRLAMLGEELRHRGVPLQAIAVGRDDGEPRLWLQLRVGEAAPVWLGLPGETVVGRLPLRLLLGLGLGAALLVAVSWFFTRRLTRPLEQLRERIETHRPGAPWPAAGALAGSASPEIAAIDAAWLDLLARLERHERERALLLAGVSHDLRSPLARIRMAAALLPDDAETLPRREAIVRNVSVADRLIESFLDHVRAGELALDQDVDLAEIARQVAARLDRGGGDPAVDAPRSLLLAGSHPLLLERMLANLLDNAFVHGGAPVRLRLAVEGGEAVVEVFDSGPGIPPEQQVQAVQAFARGDASRNTPGTGLGLAIVARVVARMGGSLEFDRPGGMHCVRLRLPLRGMPPARGRTAGGADVPLPAGAAAGGAAR